MSAHKIKDTEYVKDSTHTIVHYTNPNFHEFALNSSLFKGQNSMYFCFLKAERIAHVVTVLWDNIKEKDESSREFVYKTGLLPSKIARMVTGELKLQQVLADVFSLIVWIRLFMTERVVARTSGDILITELEFLAEKLEIGTQPSLQVTASDFLVPQPVGEGAGVWVAQDESYKRTIQKNNIKDTNKGHTLSNTRSPIESNKRLEAILKLINIGKRVSIKDISSHITDCSEKTIQRDLATLVRVGNVRRVGERRWSLYEPANP